MTSMTPFRRAIVGPLEVLIVVFAVGVIGYRWIEGWSTLDAVWMVAITLSTIGYGEVHPLSDSGRMFTLLLIGVTVLWAGTFVTQLAQVIAEGGLWNEWKQARLRRELANMHDHYVIIGRGRLGREILEELAHAGVFTIVIDPKPWDGPPQANVLHLVGDATHDAVLAEANVSRARAVAIATPSDAINVYLVLSVRQQNAAAFITVRVEEDGAAEKARRAGANRTIQPYHISGARMAAAMLRPSASAFVERAEQRQDDTLQLDDVVIPTVSPAHGRLGSLNLRRRFNLIVVGIARGEAAPIMPDDDTLVGSGDTLIVVGTRESARQFTAWANGE
jgi:voltage-gated potassium channel